MQRQIAAIVAAEQPRLDGLATRAGLRAWAEALIAAHASGDHPLRYPLVAELAAGDARAREALARWTQALAAGRRRMRALPSAADPGQLAAALLCALQGGLLLSQVHGDLAPPRAALDVTLPGCGA